MRYFSMEYFTYHLNFILPGIIAGFLVIFYSIRQELYKGNFKLLKIISDFFGSLLMSYAICKFIEIKHSEFLAFISGISWVGIFQFLRSFSTSFINASIKNMSSIEFKDSYDNSEKNNKNDS